MGSRLTYSTLGGAVLAAAAAGVLLGDSAIDQINPIYFQGAAVHPRDRGAALDETALPPARPRFADHYGWEDGQAALTSDCDGCPAIAARDAYAGGAQFAVIEPGWRVEAQPATYYVIEQAPEAAIEEQAAPAEADDLKRYAAYQIEEKPAGGEPAVVQIASAEQ
jgi:hypothetical protein